jgi:hypothetical protein
MGKRRDPRIQAKLQVRIAGIDASGRPLLQMVTTQDISRHGALLDGIQGAFKLSEIISVSFKSNKARFRVSWMGDTASGKAGQMGVQSVDPAKCIWDVAMLPPTATDTYAAKVKERRHHRRVPCKLGAELYMQGVMVSRRPGFGISIKFTEMTEEVRRQLHRFIQSLVVRGE